MTFAEAVRSVRLANHLSRRELAEGLQVCDAQLVYRWERGLKKRAPQAVLRAMWHAEPRFARMAQEIWRRCT